eukprot:1607904-Alexandrium_andersonii.AAC.2
MGAGAWLRRQRRTWVDSTMQRAVGPGVQSGKCMGFYAICARFTWRGAAQEADGTRACGTWARL